MRLIKCMLCSFVDYSRNGMKSFDVLTGDQELKDHMAIYGPEIEHSKHRKSVSQKII